MEDKKEVAWKIKRQMTTKSFSADFTIYLMDDTPRTIIEAYSFLVNWKH